MLVCLKKVNYLYIAMSEMPIPGVEEAWNKLEVQKGGYWMEFGRRQRESVLGVQRPRLEVGGFGLDCNID